MQRLILLLTLSVFGAIEAGKLIFEQKKEQKYITCPDGSYCSDLTTCCLQGSGDYGCCPFNKADCCSDKVHCCPSGYACDVPSQTCTKSSTNDTVPIGKKSQAVALSEMAVPPNPPPPGNLMCHDGSVCPGTSACCRTYSGVFKCCPYPKDVCCDDGQHCCARLTICDQRTLTCLPGSKSAPWDTPISSVPATPAPVSIENHQMEKIQENSNGPNLVCPGGTTCAGTSACCRTYAGAYNCCNFPNDVCCSDGLHCCGRGTICDVRNLRCLPGNGKILPWDQPKAAIPSV